MQDVIVLGAGTAGSIIARRLLDAGLSVTLVEAGGLDTNPAIHDLSRVGELWFGPEDWAYSSTPQQRAMNRRLHIPRGKVVGGSGQLNGTIWVRGCAWDYDGWAAAGNTGWDWSNVQPVFERMEKEFMDRIDPVLTPIQKAILEAAETYGLPLNENYNDGDQDGVAPMQLNLRAGRRLSSWAAYMRPVYDHPKLTLLTGTLVHSLVIENGAVTGVRIITNGIQQVITAGEVVLSSGALASPAILLRSGIGPASELEKLGTKVVADVAGVGRNLQDHFLVPVIFGTTKKEIAPPQPFQPVTMTHWFWKSDPSLPVPNTQPINFSVPFYYDPEMTGPASGFTLHAGLIRPQSVGRVTLNSLDPLDAPIIDFGLFTDAEDPEGSADLAALVASVRQCRAIAKTAPLAEEWGAYEALPGPGADDSDAVLAAWVRRAVNTYHHQAGTCRMGIDDNAVVGPDLRTPAISGLRIADASVMPLITTGNTNAPTAMIAERAAELILNG